MARFTPVPDPTAGRRPLLPAVILCGLVMTISTRVDAATPSSSATSAPKYTSPVPLSPSDHYVQGKYDKTGTYIPPHYQPVSKPPFHGYFFKKDKAGIDINPNQNQNKDQKPD